MPRPKGHGGPAKRWPYAASKYIYYSRASEGVGTEEELFDLASDPGEFTNLAAEHPKVCGELRDAILEWLVNTEENRVYPVGDRYPLTRVERP